MPSVETPAVSKSGITTSSTGERHIPASVRPDGTVRKEIRVRPGYRPPEDVEVYKNKTAEGFRNRGKAGIPGAEALATEDSAKPNPAANKNAKRREARKKAAEAAAAATDGKEDVQVKEHKDKDAAAPTEPEKPPNPEVDKEKEVKKLTKKLRQARELKDKKDKGDKLLPEQFEKVIKINELIRQLEALGFDAQGERKPDP